MKPFTRLHLDWVLRMTGDLSPFPTCHSVLLSTLINLLSLGLYLVCMRWISFISWDLYNNNNNNNNNKCKNVKWSPYSPGVAQRLGRGIALLFHDRGTRRRWVVSSTPLAHFTAGKDPVPILQEAGWAPGPVWKGGKSRPHRDSIPDCPARSLVAILTELPDPQ